MLFCNCQQIARFRRIHGSAVYAYFAHHHTGRLPPMEITTVKIFIPLSDEQLEQLSSDDIPVPYQPGNVTLSQLQQNLQKNPPDRGVSPDPAPARHPALRQVALPFPR